MKVIYLIRHAKSDWSNAGVSDYDRTLNKRGQNDVALMGEKLNELNPSINLIIASPAQRAFETVKYISKKIKYNFDNVDFNKSIYNSSSHNLNEIINSLNDNINTIALVAHNPGLTNLSNYLTNNYIDNIATCGIVKIELEINCWNEIIEGIGTKTFYIYPKMYE